MLNTLVRDLSGTLRVPTIRGKGQKMDEIMKDHGRGLVADALSEGVVDAPVTDQGQPDNHLAEANTGPPVCPPHTAGRGCVPNTGPPAC